MTYSREYYLAHKDKWREYGRKWREENPEKDKAKKAKYRASEKGKATEKAYGKRYREENSEAIRRREQGYWSTHKDKKREKDRRYREKHKTEQSKKFLDKYHNDPIFRAHHLARTKVNAAIRSGKLERAACESCGKAKAQAHHDDYNKSLEVRWLCAECHRKWHESHEPIYLKG